jgi:UDP-N-acetylmuramoylalanine--D-glutamate ligase
MNLSRLRVTIMGLGRHGGGVAAARFCAQAGAIVTVTDLANAESLAASVDQLPDVPIARFTLGRHAADDFCKAEVVVVNPAVRPENDFVRVAKESDAVITSETELFLDACPAMVVGVTGTVGKSTTAAMLASILQAGGRQVWLGGNIGHSLLPDLPAIRREHVVVLEMSSFQLYWLSDKSRWPQAAIVTNCCANHLDWHGTWKHYVAAKQRMVRHIPAAGFAILNSGDPEVATWPLALNRSEHVADAWPLDQVPTLLAPGQHNRVNAACAAAAGEQLGTDVGKIRAALANFSGLPHRLVSVGEISGRCFYNDSKSTTPVATLAALKTMDRPTWLLLGGAETRADFSDLLGKVPSSTLGAACFGAVGPQLHRLLTTVDDSYRCSCNTTLKQALAWCWKQSRSGDVILLSPACTSTDQFRDFIHRGEEFEHLVHSLSQE